MLKKLNKETVLPYRSSVLSLLNSANIQISTIKPSDWAEQNRVMSKELTAVEGYFNYYNTPYTREIMDCLSSQISCDTVAVIKGAQIGFSAGVIENGIGYIISQEPGNTLLLVGHDDSLKGTVNKIEQVIDGSGLRHLIRTNVKRARNVISGDTDKRKDFQGGFLKIGLTNHKSLREMTMQYGFIDDFAVANYFITNNLISNLKPAFEVKDEEFNLDLAMATNKENEILRNILEKGKDLITEEELLNLKKKWIKSNQDKIASKIPFLALITLNKMFEKSIFFQQSVKYLCTFVNRL